MAEYTDTYEQTTLRQSCQSLSSANLQSSVSQNSLSTRQRVKWKRCEELALFGKYRVEPVVVCGSSVLKQNWAAPAVVRKPPQAEQLWVTNSKTLILSLEVSVFDLVWDNLRARPIHIQKFNYLVCITWRTQIGTFDVGTALTFGSGQHMWASEESGRINSWKRGEKNWTFFNQAGEVKRDAPGWNSSR